MLVGTESVCERESAVMDRDKSIRDRAFILLLINCTQKIIRFRPNIRWAFNLLFFWGGEWQRRLTIEGMD